MILRLLVVKRLYWWRDEETEHFVADSLVRRPCCRLYLASVPDDTTLLRWANLIGPQPLEVLNEGVVALARSLKVTRGRQLRGDSLEVETHSHHPTDSRLVGDGVRVLSRWLRRAKRVLSASVQLPLGGCWRGPRCRRGFRFRAGIEGRISVLRRRCGWDRCLAHGEAGLGRWVGWAMLTATLVQIARTRVTGQAA